MATPQDSTLQVGREGKLTDKEPVELHQELEVDIVALGRLAVRALDVVTVQIDTYPEGEKACQLLSIACSLGVLKRTRLLP